MQLFSVQMRGPPFSGILLNLVSEQQLLFLVVAGDTCVARDLARPFLVHLVYPPAECVSHTQCNDEASHSIKAVARGQPRGRTRDPRGKVRVVSRILSFAPRQPDRHITAWIHWVRNGRRDVVRISATDTTPYDDLPPLPVAHLR